MAQAFVGVFTTRQEHSELLDSAGNSGMEFPQHFRATLGNWQVFLDRDAARNDLAHDAQRLLLLDRSHSGGTTGPVDARARTPAGALVSCTPSDLIHHLHDPVSFVHLTADGTVTMFRSLYCGRPIFYAVREGMLVFGSELALIQRLLRQSRADRKAVAEMVLMRWNIGTRTLVDGIRQVMPGQLVAVTGSGEIAATTARRPMFGQHSGEWSLAEATAATEAALRAEMRAVAAHHRKAVVTLSAGVDSTLLLALAREEFAEVVAITADWEGQGNPELDKAQAIAASLGVRHVKAVMRDSELPETWRTVVDRLGAGPRVLSALPLLSCFRYAANEGSVVLYGVVADSLFGSDQIGWLAVEQRRRAMLHAFPRWQQQVLRWGAKVVRGVPGRLVPRLLDNTEPQLFARDVSIEYRGDPRDYFPLYPDWPDTPEGFEPWDLAHATLDPRQRSQDYLLRIPVADYLMMVTRLTGHAGIELVNMYTTPAVLNVAEQLKPSMLFRDRVSKPILRDLAGRFVDREVIEAPKMGFPTPNRQWLEGPLAAEVAEVRALTRSGEAAWWLHPRFAELPVERDVEAWWTALGLARAFASLGLRGIADDSA